MIALVQRVAAGPLSLDRGIVNQVERHVDHVTVDLHPLGRDERAGGQVEPPVAAVAGAKVTQVAFVDAMVQRGGGGAAADRIAQVVEDRPAADQRAVIEAATAGVEQRVGNQFGVATARAFRREATIGVHVRRAVV